MWAWGRRRRHGNQGELHLMIAVDLVRPADHIFRAEAQLVLIDGSADRRAPSIHGQLNANRRHGPTGVSHQGLVNEFVDKPLARSSVRTS